MSKVGIYDRLNESSSLDIELDINDIAKQFVSMNYGTHRLLSAIVRARDNRGIAWQRPDELADGIRDLLNAGLF